MEKQEFLEKLRLALGGKVSPEVMADTMDYYEDYINTELRLGKSSDEVMAALGDPRLIARTIVETRGGRSVDGSASADGEDEYGRNRELRRHVVGIPGWVWLILFFVVFWIIVSVIFKVLFKLAPILLVVSLVVYLYRRFGGDT